MIGANLRSTAGGLFGAVFPEESEDGVVGGFAGPEFAEDEVMDSAVDGRNLAFGTEGGPDTGYHVRIEHTVSGLELGSPVASGDLTAAVHHQYRHGDVTALFLQEGGKTCGAGHLVTVELVFMVSHIA